MSSFALGAIHAAVAILQAEKEAQLSRQRRLLQFRSGLVYSFRRFLWKSVALQDGSRSWRSAKKTQTGRRGCSLARHRPGESFTALFRSRAWPTVILTFTITKSIYGPYMDFVIVEVKITAVYGGTRNAM